MSAMTEQSCVTCRFSNFAIAEAGEDDIDVGAEPVFECRRYPPSFIPGAEGFAGIAHPSVAAEGWCGEWMEEE